MIRLPRPPLGLALALALIPSAAPAPAMAQDTAPAVAPPPAALDGEAAAEIDLAAIPATLMMPLDEMIAVEDAISAGPLARLDDAEDLADPSRFRLRVPLYLSAIVWEGPGDWTIWINDRAFSPDDMIDLFDILDVGPRTVVLAIPWGEGGTREITMAPHQTFVPRLGGVVEGRWG